MTIRSWKRQPLEKQNRASTLRGGVRMLRVSREAKLRKDERRK